MASIFNRLRKPASTEVGDDLGTAVSSAPPVELDPPAVPQKPPVFSGDAGVQDDALGFAAPVRRIAELASHAGTQTPLSIGIFGAAGTGKSFALTQLLNDITAFGRAASDAASTPFVKRIATARVDAATAGDPDTALANALHDALNASAPGQASYAEWAEAVTLRSGDPRQMVREESDRLTDLRRQQDSEKQALEEIQSRRARLTESVLYDSAGTRIDSYARSNRASIESRLAGFGFANSDPIATFKDLVRDYAENGGMFRRMRVFFHALWAFNGQMKLLVLAILFAALGWLFGQFETPPLWLSNFLARIQDNFSSFAGAIKSIKDNSSLLAMAGWFAAAGAILLTIVRAVRFLSPIKRGATLLNADMETRRRDLDNLIAAQSERVEELGKEAASQANRLSDAQLRADAARTAPGAVTRSPFAPGGDEAQGRARGFFAAVAASLASGSDASAPQRIVVAIDNLDSLPPAQAAAFVQKAKALLANTGLVTAIAVDPQHLKTGLEQTGQIGNGSAAPLADAIARLVQVPFRTDAQDVSGFGNLVQSLLGKAPKKANRAPGGSQSVLDEPMRPGEPELLTALSDLAGSTPRQVKRFINIYRMLRSDVSLFAPLVLALSVQSGARDNEKQEFEKLLQGLDDSQPIPAPQQIDTRIAFAVKAASSAQVTPVTVGAIREAQVLIAPFSGNF
ncbi:MAG: hypothetical protein KDJ29_11890 [Hyphomicrobiales bacterium]|nr:hypothetical protein [Hyphomicrobiales bacterium]